MEFIRDSSQNIFISSISSISNISDISDISDIDEENDNLVTVFQFPFDTEIELKHDDSLDLTLSIDWIKNSSIYYNRLKKNKAFQGPICQSNWLSLNLCVGGYPDSKREVDLLLDDGIDAFICLNGSDKATFYKYEVYLPSNITYIWEPIKDMHLINDDKIIELASRIVSLIVNGRKVYIHCAGGHGRTGTVAAAVLYKLYEISLPQLFDYLQYSHDQRVGNYFGFKYFNEYLDDEDSSKKFFARGQVPTPQTKEQRQQVERIISRLRFM